MSSPSSSSTSLSGTRELQTKYDKKSVSLDAAEISFFGKLQQLIAIPRRRARESGSSRRISTICGADAAYSRKDNAVTAVAATLSDRKVLETFTYHGHFTFPYASGLFFLHEGPFVVAAIMGLKSKPDIVCFDAHGLAHPRHLGLATVCGMILDTPSIGLAKSRLVGEVQQYKDGLEKVVDGNIEVGFITNLQGVKRYWSPGFSVSMDELELIILNHSETCIKAVTEADKTARSDM